MTPCKGMRYLQTCALREGCARYRAWQALCVRKPARRVALLSMPCHNGDLSMHVRAA